MLFLIYKYSYLGRPPIEKVERFEDDSYDGILARYHVVKETDGSSNVRMAQEMDPSDLES